MLPIFSVVQQDDEKFYIFLLSTFVAICNDFIEVCGGRGGGGTFRLVLKNNKFIKKAQCCRNQVFPLCLLVD